MQKALQGLGADASGSVQGIGRFQNGHSRKRLAFVLHRRPLRCRRTCAGTSSAICIAFSVVPLRKLSATIQVWAAIFRDPSQASGGSGTDTAANGSPLSCTGVRFVVDGHALAQAPRFASRSGRPLCANCPRLSRAGRRYFGIRRKHRAAPERIQPQTARPLSCTGVRFVVDGRALAQAPRFASRSGQPLCANCPRLPRVGRRCFGIRRKHRAAPERTQPQTACLCLAQASASSSTDVRRHKLRDLHRVQGSPFAQIVRDYPELGGAASGSVASIGRLRNGHSRKRLGLCLAQASASSSTNVRQHKLRDLHRVQGSPFAQIVRDYPELGGAASGSVASIGRLRNGHSRKRLAFVLHRRPLRRRRTCAGTSSAICIAFSVAPLRKLSATIQSWAAMLRDPSQASGGSGTDTAANGSPLSCTGVRFVVDERAPAQAPRFASRSGQPLCANCPQLPRVGRRCFGIRRKHRAAPERTQPQTARLCLAQASASSSTNVRQHKLRDLHRVQGSPFAQVVRNYPELGGDASGSVASIGRLRNGHSRKRLAFVLHRCPLRRRRTCAGTSSAICIAFRAVPLRKLSATVQSWAALLRDPSQASGGSGTDTAANGSPFALYRCPLRHRRMCVSRSSAICIAFRAAPLRKLSATVQSWAALLRDPSQASGGSGTDKAANGLPLSCTGVRFVVDGRAPAQAPRFASRSGQSLCASCPRLSRSGRRCFGIRRKHRAAPERTQPQTALLCLAQVSAASSTNVRRHKLRDLHRVQGSPFAQIVRDCPELGGAASGSVASIGRLRNGHSRKRLSFVLAQASLAQASASSSTDVRRHKLRDLHRVQGSPFAQIVRDCPELGGAASGSVASIGRLRNGHSRKRLAFVLAQASASSTDVRAQAPRFASRSGQSLCANCPRLSRVGRWSSGSVANTDQSLKRLPLPWHRRPLRRSTWTSSAPRSGQSSKLSATVRGAASGVASIGRLRNGYSRKRLGLCLAQASASSSTDVRRHKLRDLYRVQGGPFAQIVRDYPELGGAASGSVASIGRLRNGYSRKRLAFCLIQASASSSTDVRQHKLRDLYRVQGSPFA